MFGYSAFNKINASDSIIILLEIENNKQVYKIKDKLLKLSEIYERLSKLIISKGRFQTVVVIASQKIALEKLINLRGLIQKVGFSDMRFFYFDDQKKMMAEISFDKPAIPFSRDPEYRGKSRDTILNSSRQKE